MGELSALINWWRGRRQSVALEKSPRVWGQIRQVASCTLHHEAAGERRRLVGTKQERQRSAHHLLAGFKPQPKHVSTELSFSFPPFFFFFLQNHVNGGVCAMRVCSSLCVGVLWISVVFALREGDMTAAFVNACSSLKTLRDRKWFHFVKQFLHHQVIFK